MFFFQHCFICPSASILVMQRPSLYSRGRLGVDYISPLKEFGYLTLALAVRPNHSDRSHSPRLNLVENLIDYCASDPFEHFPIYEDFSPSVFNSVKRGDDIWQISVLSTTPRVSAPYIILTKEKCTPVTEGRVQGKGYRRNIIIIWLYVCVSVDGSLRGGGCCATVELVSVCAWQSNSRSLWATHPLPLIMTSAKTIFPIYIFNSLWLSRTLCSVQCTPHIHKYPSENSEKEKFIQAETD